MIDGCAEGQEHLEARLVAECRALLAMLWAGYSRAEAEEALREEPADGPPHRRARHRPHSRHGRA